MEEGGAKMDQCNNKPNKLDEIHRNVMRISHKLLYSHRVIHVKFVRNSYKFHVNFVQFGNAGGKHTSKHTLQSHGHVTDHAPGFVHLGAATLGLC